ncbi:MAG TPA: electron transfer flavoprotein subunit beta/FixA family protein [Planctomycetota bacterium]|nr:electron transfer flavoprotein subunit beta/FixA family protein [Planctomycetota bacterium]
MPYNMIVLAKQVPDTKNITGEAMTANGTVNRSALPAIFNPEDLNALEMALSVKERHGGHVTVITMGPPPAAEILRESLMRGADAAILVSDRRFAAADTLATAYALGCAINKIGPYHIIFCGRQAIDGDTAQIGPQVAGKLNIPQITYVEEIRELHGNAITARRNIEGGYEIIQTRLPALLTVVATANEPRPPAAKRLLQYKKARTATEIRRAMQGADAEKEIERLADRGLLIREWSVEDILADEGSCGIAGSPTRVMKIQSVVLTAGSHRNVPATRDGIVSLIQELIEDHAIG